MIALLFMIQLLSLTQLHAADAPHPKKKRHYHNQMAFVEDQASPLRSSQKSTTPRSVPYVGLQHGGTLEIYCHNAKTTEELPAETMNGAKLRLNAIVHVTRPKQ